MAEAKKGTVPLKPIIGIAGGIGSGKSTVAAMLGELGAAVISSDELNRELLKTPDVLSALRDRIGQRIFTPDGQLDRTAIRQLMSEDDQARRAIEAILHPRVGQRRLELTRHYQADPNVRAVVWDSPLLFEAGLDRQCDAVIFVEADQAVRRERVSPRYGWTMKQMERLEKTQKPLDFKKDNADHRVVNNSDRDALRRQVEEVFSQILSGD